MKKLYVIIILSVMWPKVMAGAWDIGSFDNDSALDWVNQVKATNSESLLLSTLKKAFSNIYLEEDICSSVIAAAEVVASLKTKEFSALPESLQDWTKRHQELYEPEMSKYAIGAIESCVNVEKSELAELWSETGSGDWAASVKNLKEKLK